MGTRTLEDYTSFWAGRRVLVTGHTGFKGSWLCRVLMFLGADIYGISLPPNSMPSMFEVVGRHSVTDSTLQDIRDIGAIRKKIRKIKPDIVFHLAAQSIVRTSYFDPLNTFSSNIMGTTNILEVLREMGGCEAIVVVTTDKVYKNSDTGLCFREEDALGGDDPYAASKAATELVAHSYKEMYLPSLVTARGGNVIGGGDFSKDRLIPDIVRSIMNADLLFLRNPKATRPWQHVLDCLNGYIIYAQTVAKGDKVPSSLNIAPVLDDKLTVADVATRLFCSLGIEPNWKIEDDPLAIEKKLLSIDASLAQRAIGWSDRYTALQSIQLTADWYGAYKNNEDLVDYTDRQIEAFYSQ